ncbi:hypothetical protein CANMA_003967 [Candida margitis]|uniref:uncharacterized protein n=1 Tax=Candida margitis TaxID=1775924 RepID=UPI002227E112|nr:uncharacterized protein CANMA_003967 [Candida margitis]KAI5960705.1 hypothetical protein CANMA_003967 [Candida margitis]
MSGEDDITSQIKHKLASYLNKPENESLTKTVIAQAQGKTPDDFIKFTQIIGLKNDEHAKDIYDSVQASKSILSATAPKKSRLNTQKSGKPAIRLSFEDDDDDNDMDEIVSPNIKVHSKDNTPTQPKFKKLRKEDAEKLKEMPPGDVKRESPKENSDCELPRIQTHRPTSNQQNGSQKLSWNSRVKQQNLPNISSNESTGGYFDSKGEYIDYDHSPGNDFNRIPITSHVLIPPFLEKVKEHLTLQISGSSIRGAGPTVDPVKDSTSELASMAKQGSLVVQTKRSKQERAKQVKEKTGVAQSEKVEELGEQQDEGEQKIDFDIIQKQRKSLPAYAVKDDVVSTIRDNQVTIIIGETGSGKTTQLAQFLYEQGLATTTTDERKIIGCTQPRRVAAMSVAKRVSEEMQVQLGKEVGYSVRFDDKTDPQKTVIKYMTEGILLREILADNTLSEYSCIIIDEAHERSLNTDILLGLFRGLLTKRRDLKLIVTSATMNADRFTRFFGAAPQFTIPGRTFPVDVYFNKNVTMDYVETTVKQILSIHLSKGSDPKSEFVNDGDILVFMTGQEDIEITCGLLREKLEMLENPPPLEILPIYSTMPQELQKRIFNKSSVKKRKVVIATNIAETSLTVDGIKYVIDCGLVKVKVYNPKLGMDTLQVVPISLANAEQRSGRAGRTGAGVAYRLYTERATDPQNMYQQPIPEIQRTNLSNTMLLLKSLNVHDINNFPFLDSPPKDLLNCSLYDLWAMGALDNFGELTKLGRDMIQFPIEPSLSKLILLSTESYFRCSEDVLTIVAMLSVSNIFQRSKERAKEADSARERFIVAESDHLTLLNAYTQWETNMNKFGSNWNRINEWCNRNFIQHKSLYRAREIRKQLAYIMQKKNLPFYRAKNDDDIRRCLCAAYYHQSAKLVKMGVNGTPEFINLRHNYMKMYLHPTSGLLNSNLGSNFVIYHDLILTSKEYMNCVTCVDPMWLLEFGYVFYGVPESSRDKLVDTMGIHTGEEFKHQLENDRVLYGERNAKAQTSNNKGTSTTNKKSLLFRKRRRM